MKYASMPKFSILPPIGDDKLPRLCSDDPIQILFKLAQFLTLRTKPFKSSEHHRGNISPTICTNMLIFSKDTFLILIFRIISTNLIFYHLNQKTQQQKVVRPLISLVIRNCNIFEFGRTLQCIHQIRCMDARENCRTRSF